MRTRPGSRTRLFRPTVPVLGLLCALWPAVHAHAQNERDDSTTRPAAAGRVVKAFDFEEQDLNPLPVPLGWIRAQDDPAVPRERPGFPIWNGAALDYESPAYSGIGSVRLPTNGGSTALLLRHGVLSIFPNADYLVSARVRTKGLSHARARIVAMLLDERGEPIPTSRVESAMVRSEGEWARIAIEVEGLEPEAAFMQIELQLLQPEQQQRKTYPFQVWQQDFEGAAWFDDLIVAQLPRLEITTGAPGNIVAADTPPDLHILVRDLTGDQIDASLRIFDVHANLVQGEMLRDDGRRVQRRYETTLPAFGWYRALLEVFVDRRLVGVRTLDFIWAPPEAATVTPGIFSIESTLVEPKLAQATPVLVRGAGVNRAALRVWDEQTSVEDLEPGSVRNTIIDALLDSGKRLSFTLQRLPAPLASTLAVDPGEVLKAFEDADGPWLGWGARMLDQYGQRVDMLQFGSNPTLESPALLGDAMEDARRALRGFVPGPTAAIPWPVDRPLPPELSTPGNAIQLIDDHAATPDELASLVDRWLAMHRESTGNDETPARLGLTLRPKRDPSGAGGLQAWSSVGDLARRGVSYWWSAATSGIDRSRFELRLHDAWWVSPGKRGQVMPAPELLAWRVLSEHLSGREALERIELIPGVRMLVLAPRTGQRAEGSAVTDADAGGLVLWLDEPSLDPVSLSLPLAQGPVRVSDVMGNQREVMPTPTGNIGVGMHHIEITRAPIFVEGVNAELVRFLGSLGITPGVLESRSGVHRHELSIRNPWDIPISGRVFVVEPGGYTGDADQIDRSWEINPRVIPFDLGPGETDALRIDFAYSLGELAGAKDLVFDVQLNADRDYPTLRVARSIDLQLSGVEMTLSARRNEAGITVVSAEVTHQLDDEQHFDLIAIAPGEARLRRTVNALAPGQRATRQFAFTRPVPGDEISVVLIPRDPGARLNKSVVVP